jgi:metallo-beta-lactamase class B
VRPVVEAGLVKLGLDPADIKYVIVTHGHDDHYGGSAYLQERYGARIMMGTADWQVKSDPGMKGIRDPMPRRDLDAADVTLGGVSVRVVATPGHTPGTIPVTDNGEPHVAALWGGGFPLPTLDLARDYARSAASFAEIVRATGADVFLSNHPSNDESLAKMKALSQRQPAEANPFVIGRQAVVQRFRFTEQCAQAYVALHAR